MAKQSSTNDIAAAKHMIALAAEDAVKAIANAAAAATKVTDTKNGNDHDLIIEIKTIQQTMLAEILEIKNGTARNIADLQNQKLNINDSYPVLYKKGVDERLTDHETRLGKLETFNTRVALMLSGGIFALGFLITLIVYHIMGE